MGLLSQAVRFIIDEHKRSPLRGDGIFIGRQQTTLTPHSVVELLHEEGLTVRHHAPHAEMDRRTSGARGHTITDASALNYFADLRFKALDMSDYEGAEIVCNLNNPLPDELCGIADFMYEGSCLDNIFDPCAALVNMSRLLRPHGRIVIMDHGSDYNGPYLKFTAEWFYNYYLLNRFSDVRVYHAWFNRLSDPWELYEWEPGFMPEGKLPVPHGGDYMVFATATKTVHSTCDKRPIQACYRSLDEKVLCTQLAVENITGRTAVMPTGSKGANGLRFVRQLANK